jgi:hypothetical protein
MHQFNLNLTRPLDLPGSLPHKVAQSFLKVIHQEFSPSVSMAPKVELSINFISLNSLNRLQISSESSFSLLHTFYGLKLVCSREVHGVREDFIILPRHLQLF